ncbi:hypothetical protein [Luteimonas sp. e5]
MKYVIAAVLALVSTSAFCQNPATDAEALLKAIQDGNAAESIESVFEGTVIQRRNPASIQSVKGQVENLFKAYGTPRGYEKACEKDLSPSYKRLVYLQKFDDLPIAWQFYYYKPGNEWTLTNLRFNDNVVEILDSCR